MYFVCVREYFRTYFFSSHHQHSHPPFRIPGRRRAFQLSHAFTQKRGARLWQASNSASADITCQPSCGNAIRVSFLFPSGLLVQGQQGRDFDCITISASESDDCEDWMMTRDPGSLHNNAVKKKRKVVLITSRMHPAETPSSFVCQGMFLVL